MAENLVSKPPLQVKIIDQTGLMSRPWSVWFRDLYSRVAYKGSNSIDGNTEAISQSSSTIEANTLAISQSSSTIEANTLAISQNTFTIEGHTLAISQNTVRITSNIQTIALLTNSLNTHVNASLAHNSNGDIVGFDDTATESKVGLVKRLASIADAVETTVDITTADIGTAPAAYDQAYTQSVTNLTNENKAAINQLGSDLNDAIAVLNNLLAESKISGQMTTP